jgi:translocation and assembly module TamB
MTEPDSPLSVPANTTPPKRRRWRRVLIFAACVLFIVVVLPVAFYFWASSNAMQNLVRKGMIDWLEQASGGRVEIGAFHWHLLDLQADAEDVVIHGREAPGEAPCARIERLRASITLLGLISPRVLLRDLEISHPALHVIVYADGTTNLPTPRKPKKPAKSALDTLFDLQAGHVSVTQGDLDFESRSTDFDFQTASRCLLSTPMTFRC